MPSALTATCAAIDELVATIASPDVGPDEVQAVVHQVQSFDPPGVAARDLQECLLLQLRQLPAIPRCGPRPLTCAPITSSDWPRAIWTPSPGGSDSIRGDLALTIGLIRSLNPRPGLAVADMQPEYIIPDVSGDPSRWGLALRAKPGDYA